MQWRCRWGGGTDTDYREAPWRFAVAEEDDGAKDAGGRTPRPRPSPHRGANNCAVAGLDAGWALAWQRRVAHRRRLSLSLEQLQRIILSKLTKVDPGAAWRKMLQRMAEQANYYSHKK